MRGGMTLSRGWIIRIGLPAATVAGMVTVLGGTPVDSRRIFLLVALVMTVAMGALALALFRYGAAAFFDARLFGLAGIFVFLVMGMLKSVFIYDAPITTDTATAAKAALVALLSLTGFALGSWLRPPAGLPGRLSRAELSLPRLTLAAIALGVVGTSATVLFNSPLEPFDPGVSHYARLLAGCLPAAGALAIWLLFTMRPATLWKRFLWLAVLVPWPLLALVSDSRVPLAFLLSFAFLVYVYRWWAERRNKFTVGRVAVLAVTLVVLLFFAAAVVDVLAASYWRVDLGGVLVHDDVLLNPVQAAFRQLTAIDAFDNLVRTVGLYPDRNRYLYGWSLAAVVVNPIPRSVWPAKPYGYSRLLVEEMGLGRYRQLSLSASLAGELLANFGYVGPFLGYLVLGLLATFFYQRFLQAQPWSPAHLLYLSSLLMFLLESRGDLLSITVRLGWYLICLYAAVRFALAERA